MKTLVVYESAYGNTAQLGNAISQECAKYGEVHVKRIGDVRTDDLAGLDLMVIGSPTQGGRPTESVMQFITSLPAEIAEKAKIAVYDTRFEIGRQSYPLRILMTTIGYAAPKMAKLIRQRGYDILLAPKGFIVKGMQGPLRDGEQERATKWARKLHASIKMKAAVR